MHIKEGIVVIDTDYDDNKSARYTVMALCSYGLHSHGLHIYGLHSHDLYNYGPYSYGLDS